ncbi:transposase [Streptomyces javensis]|uniref:transposase n=1 Tax=Streptomyces javensis TaxID=114698 RepID=UPI0033F5F01B
MIDAIAYKFQTGTQYVHLPEKHGNWRGVYNRLRMWAAAGCRACAPHRGHGGRPGRGRNLPELRGLRGRVGHCGPCRC